VGVILQALLLDLPEALETPRDPAGNLYDSCMYARIF